MRKFQHANYVVTIVPSKSGGYTCWFADFPEAFTQGENLADAILMAEDVLRLWLMEYKPIGNKELPTPSAPEQVESFLQDKLIEFGDSVDSTRAVFHSIIKIPLIPNKRTRIEVSLGQSDLYKIELKAKELGITRSKLLVKGALKYKPKYK